METGDDADCVEPAADDGESLLGMRVRRTGTERYVIACRLWVYTVHTPLNETVRRVDHFCDGRTCWELSHVLCHLLNDVKGKGIQRFV